MDTRSVLRQKTIRELDEKRKEALMSRSRTLEALGKSLFERCGDAFPREKNDYCRFTQEIADSEQSIRSIRDVMARIRQLNEEIGIKKQERSGRHEELGILLTALGKELLTGAGELPGALFSVKRQYELCVSQKESLEERLQDLEDDGGSGIFVRIGNGIRALILRFSLKRQEELRQKIYGSMGRKYLDLTGRNPGGQGEASPPEETAVSSGNLVRDALVLDRALEELDNAIRVLETEKRGAELSLGARESPFRRIKALERQAEKSREDLRELYLALGENASSGHPSVSPLLTGEDRASVEEAARFQNSADAQAAEIETIETAVMLDRERNGLLRLERALAGRKNRLAGDEKAIEELNRKIDEARDRIAALDEHHTERNNGENRPEENRPDSETGAAAQSPGPGTGGA